MEQDASIAFARTPRRSSRLLRLVSDERLVTLAGAGDEIAFEAIYDRHHRQILAFSRHMLGSREEAEDAVQHTFIAAHRALTTAEQPNALRLWLFAIARNRCLSMLRARRHQVPLDDIEPATEGLSATVERREDLRQLLADLGRLPEEQRAALLLSELAAFDHEGIAEVLGCRREKVKALVYQARSSLTAARDARATPCQDIREQLATATGAALRRGPLRRHLSDCAGCRAFQDEIKLQRKLFAIALPVVPTAALKASVLGAIMGNGTGGGSAGGAAAAAHVACASCTGAGGATGGGVGAFMATGAAKVAATLVIGSAVAGGGAAVTLERSHDDRPVAAEQHGTASIPATRVLTTQLAGSPGGRARAMTPTTPPARRSAEPVPAAERAATSAHAYAQAVGSPPVDVGHSGGGQPHELSAAHTEVNARALPDSADDRGDHEGRGDRASPPRSTRRGADAAPGRSADASPKGRPERAPDSPGNVARRRAPGAPQPRTGRPDVVPAPPAPRATPAPGNDVPGDAAPRPNAAPRAPPPPREGSAPAPRGGPGDGAGGSGDAGPGAGGPTPTVPAAPGRAAPRSSRP